MRKLVAYGSAAIFFALAGCGGGSSNSTPTNPTPTPTPTQTNRAPVISSVTVTPSFGIADLQTFNFAAVASDPDGDSVSYSWDLAGNARSGANPSIIFASPGGVGSGTISVNDGKGGSASSSVTFTVGSMSGAWLITVGPLAGASFQLTQTPSGFVTGSFNLPGIGSGQTDPAQPGQIRSDGNVTMRVKIAPFTDFNMIGAMDTTGRRVTGSLQGSGFTGQPFVLAK